MSQTNGYLCLKSSNNGNVDANEDLVDADAALCDIMLVKISFGKSLVVTCH
jgi:hypothetical protein